MVTLVKGTRVRVQHSMTGVVLGPGNEPGHVRIFWDEHIWVSDYPVELLEIILEDQP
jgi:hypothetical protein